MYLHLKLLIEYLHSLKCHMILCSKEHERTYTCHHGNTCDEYRNTCKGSHLKKM